MNDTTAPTPPTAAAPSSASARDLVIKCTKLTKVFKDFWMRPRVKAVNNVDLDVQRGEVFGLLGPNGSGKSTTIKLLLGLLHPTSGRIAVFGKRPEDVAVKEIIGFLPEESYLYRFLNARETLDYYGRLFHQSRQQRRRRIDMLLEMVGLDAAQNRSVGEYSKGMMRRLGLAQALINDPQLLILDEPTTGLDPIGTRQIKDLIHRLAEPRQGKPGKTVLLCSHLLSDVEDVCDRVAIMFGGRVVQEGTIDSLLTQHDVTTIDTPNLDDETIEQIEQVLQKRGKAIERISHRRQTLEKLFLDLVERERARGAETSGAQSGGRIAGFLVEDEQRGGHMPDDAHAAAVLGQLIAPSSPAEARKPPAERESVAAAGAQAADVPDASQQPVDEVLASLSAPRPPADKPQHPANAAEAAQPAQEAADPDEDVDLSVLGGLVMGDPAAPTDAGPPKAAQPEAAPSAEAPRRDDGEDDPDDDADDDADDADRSPSAQAATPDAPAAAQGPLDLSDEAPADTAATAAPPASDEAQDASPAGAQDDDETGPSAEAEAPHKPEPEPQPATPEPPQRPEPEVSRFSGESGLGLMHGLSDESDALDLRSLKASQSQSAADDDEDAGESDEKPDRSFMDAIDNIDHCADDDEKRS